MVLPVGFPWHAETGDDPEPALARPAWMPGHGFEPFPRDVERRAWELLTSHLNVMQEQELYQLQHFQVEGSRGTLYRIRVAPTFNVDELDEEGHTVATLCVVPVEAIPKGDRLLAQALLLEADEARFWSIANKEPYGWDIPPWEREPGAESPGTRRRREYDAVVEDQLRLMRNMNEQLRRMNEAFGQAAVDAGRAAATALQLYIPPTNRQ